MKMSNFPEKSVVEKLIKMIDRLLTIEFEPY